MRKVLGVVNSSAESWYKNNLKIPLEEVESLIEKRTQARQNKDFALADSLREELAEKGVELIDVVGGGR